MTKINREVKGKKLSNTLKQWTFEQIKEKINLKNSQTANSKCKQSVFKWH